MSRMSFENDYQDQRTISLAFVWLLIVISGFVMVEPSPFELYGAVLVIISFTFGMRIPKGIGLAIIFWVVFLVFNIISSVQSADPSMAIKPVGIRFFLILIWLFITCFVYENPKRFLPLIWSGYAFGAFIVVLIGILAYMGKIPNSDQYLLFGRVKSTFKDPNVYSPYLTPVFMIYLSRLESGKDSHIFINVIMLTTISVGLLLGFSRGSWLNLGLAMMAYLIIRLVTMKESKELSRLIGMGVIALIIGSFLMGWLISTSAISDLFQERAQVVQGYDVSERFSTQMKAMNTILELPLGFGPGQTILRYGSMPHNVYLHLFSESGWISGLAYVSFVILTIWKGFIFCLRKTEIQLSALVVFSCILSTQLQSFFIDSHHWRHLFILYGMMWGAMLGYDKIKNTSKP